MKAPLRMPPAKPGLKASPAPGGRAFPSGYDLPALTIDATPPLTSVLDCMLRPQLGLRLTRLAVDASDGNNVSETDLQLVSMMAPELEQLELSFDVCERPAPAVGPELAGLRRLVRLRVQLHNARFNYVGGGGSRAARVPARTRVACQRGAGRPICTLCCCSPGPGRSGVEAMQRPAGGKASPPVRTLAPHLCRLSSVTCPPAYTYT